MEISQEHIFVTLVEGGGGGDVAVGSRQNFRYQNFKQNKKNKQPKPINRRATFQMAPKRNVKCQKWANSKKNKPQTTTTIN
jgi:hypothetical protein